MSDMPQTPSQAEPERRRARHRRQLLADVEAEARRLLATGGATAVSMRAIARAVGVGPATLYTYFDSIDDIFTTLLLKSYQRLAAATRSATEAFPEPAADRILAGILAHRWWALDHRHEFNLLFTDMLPSYAAPPDGPTVEAQVAVFEPITTAFAQARPDLDDADRLERSVQVWMTFHGAVALEVNHHLDWLEDAAARHERIVRAALDLSGLPPATPTLRQRFERWAGLLP